MSELFCERTAINSSVDFVQIFKRNMPRYGYRHLCTEDDDYKYYQTLNIPCIERGFMGRHCNYGASLKDVDV